MFRGMIQRGAVSGTTRSCESMLELLTERFEKRKGALLKSADKHMTPSSLDHADSDDFSRHPSLVEDTSKIMLGGMIDSIGEDTSYEDVERSCASDDSSECH